MIRSRVCRGHAFRIAFGISLMVMLLVGSVGAIPSTGKWQGLTSQGEKVSFIVKDNSVNTFNITFNCGWGKVGYVALSTPIVSDKFYQPGYYFSYEGTFTSLTTATGTSNISEWNPPNSPCILQVSWEATAVVPLIVTSPNGGENWARGTTKTILWTSSGNPGTYVKIELLKGGVLNSVISSNTPNDGSFDWVIPSTQALGNDYKVRITSTSNPAITDVSNNNFIISSAAPSSIIVTYPNGGEKFVRGTTKALKWSYSGSPGPYVKIELLKGGVLNRVISYSTPIGSSGLGSYNWVIPPTQTRGSDYKIRIKSTSNSAITDVSNNNFLISNPYITVISPNGGESWKRGTTKTITWAKDGNTGSYVKIDIYKGGVFKKTIVSSTPNDGSHPWYIPTTQTLGSDYKIKITSTSNSAYYDWSNNNFRIY